ncbi:beta-lactamase family protein [Agromyces sp. SYSU K20354]|uniref:serine hydrolase domain-containing protein n=1 Tax=Agromyces cavernae TaxID=2898659 RepID=UPI001E3F915A|nr:serine hydrolase domain-containing protein [Agromyces cavernae]MCD2440938.1 beta-lactamase family protein [Agromyces cavernae]
MGDRGKRGWRSAVAAFATAAALALTGCTGGTVDPGQQFDPVDAAFDEELVTSLEGVLDQAIALSGSSGGVAGVWAPWAGSWSAASGAVSLGEAARPASTENRFRLGPLTAELTCTVLLRLVEAGTVSLDDPVTDYVDRVAGLDGITLEQLCRHTSGLADYYPGLEPHFIANPERVWSPNELLATGLANNRTGTPGQKWSYSRTGILLLGLALEEATGRTWNELVEQYVADPLGLEDTALPGPSTTRLDGVLGAYAASIAADGKPVCDAVLDDSAQSSSMGGVAAGAVSSLDDVRKLSEAFATGSLLGEHHARAQWTTSPLGGSAPPWQTFGIGGAEYGPLRGGFGESPGALTAAFTDPETGLTVVVALNNSTSGADFVRETAFALASLGSKAAAAGERQRPLVELPWSFEQATTKMTELGLCPTPADAPEEAPTETPAPPAEG